MILLLGYGEETLSIPHGPSFKKLVDLFSESDCSLKLDKLIILLRFAYASHYLIPLIFLFVLVLPSQSKSDKGFVVLSGLMLSE